MSKGVKRAFVAVGVILVAGLGGLWIARAAGIGNEGQPGVDATIANRARAAAVAAVPGSTAETVDRDTQTPGVAYDVTVAKADGSAAEVRLGSDFHVVGVAPFDSGNPIEGDDSGGD